ncbi:hypothetical protein J2Z80_001749 [Thermoanaerobacterium butyriciformans]|uniref:Uncharacterized protein n=1 Tax=Thermoanaerobacterium butyriciformans TaxID=1702242 RepID=A0ABS4NEY3_9THEO|nr:hypothetical protein [Thermoanaerobacterium butyriciformans]
MERQNDGVILMNNDAFIKRGNGKLTGQSWG